MAKQLKIILFILVTILVFSSCTSRTIIMPSVDIPYTTTTNCFFDDSQKEYGYVYIYTPPTTHIVVNFNGNISNEYITNNQCDLYKISLSMLDGDYEFICKDISTDKIIATYNTHIDGLSETQVFTNSISMVDFYNNINLYNLSNDLWLKSKDTFSYIENVVKYVHTNIKYEYYDTDTLFIDLNNILFKRSGVCLDQAVLTCALIRCQGIPCKLVFGYNPYNEFHAWCEIFINDSWIIGDSTVGKLIEDTTTYTVDKIF